MGTTQEGVAQRGGLVQAFAATRARLGLVTLLFALAGPSYADPPLPVISNQVFIVTNTTGTVTNYLDIGVATNVPARYYRVRLVP